MLRYFRRKFLCKPGQELFRLDWLLGSIPVQFLEVPTP
ncbi:hypothetical protein LINPERPRIM_LOCUS31277 [Linum perenne]